MSEKQKPVVIEHDSNAESRQEKKAHYIKDSSSRIINIAENHGLDTLLKKESPEKTALERCLIRERKHKAQNQKNLEQILKLAHLSCKDETAGDPEQDWLYRFFAMAQEVHNTSMQRLWAQVLKREVTNPGSTSMKALKILQDMSPKEAQILQKAASLACSFGGDNNQKLLIGFRSLGGIFSFGKRNVTGNINMGSFKLPYSSLLVLFELGLMHGTELESGEIDLDTALPLNYQGKQLSLQAHSKGVRLLYYRFSPTGNELCKLLGNKPNMPYYDQLIGLLSQKFTAHTNIQSHIDHTV
ncbi:TIGR03899 family protein [Vibrio ostreicida]|uniref:TIGR03899 family protein n=1 Tax=Vibrio ostreicida TaxID=526588 RepID=A0ABT8BPG2_9VIBR|nr:TIGR03899 family protein [Vibrio ostreicida]MDN3608329.1 TIGR03899 family protein [Vibrio ostreicida]NPD09688.1 TIGR03899 family protein [Vibrio ostreicida]